MGIQYMDDKMKNVKATADLFKYRNLVLGLSKKQFRDLQAGKVVKISESDFDKYPKCYVEIKEKNNGS